jgi:hypothetical protein
MARGDGDPGFLFRSALVALLLLFVATVVVCSYKSTSHGDLSIICYAKHNNLQFAPGLVGSEILEFDRLLARNLVTVTALAVGLAAIINLESFR